MIVELQPKEAGRRAFTVNEFCDAYRISRSKLYLLWKDGAGPIRKAIGAKTIITVEAAEQWARTL
jgi:hypothetical protein